MVKKTNGEFWQRCFLNAFSLVILSLWGHLLYSSLHGSSTFSLYLRLKDNLAGLREKLTKINQENNSLANEIDRVEQSKGYALRILKERYNFTEPGEQIVYFAD